MTDKKDAGAVVRRVIAEHYGSVTVANVSDEDRLEKFGGDSLALMELVLLLELELDVTIPDNRLDAAETVGDIIKIVEEYQ